MWTPAEIRRLIAQLAGVALTVGGFVLLVLGIRASGRINVSSSILSGEIESGSAGLFLLFIGFLLIALPIFWDSRHPTAAQPSLESARPMGKWHVPDHFRLLVVTLCLAFLSLLLLFGGELLVTKFNVASGMLLQIAGAYVGIVTGMAGIMAVVDWVSSSPASPAKRADPPKS